ncbi:MAG: hypothetical protein AUH42_03745 [Gemmatimonadetes bacterium 13_1_40CM_70_11]|nr:MAG: hypothetical protein AUH42_03745 [Gemmatimonadetes bacterium 13_1_40CM_70_11]
MLVTEFTGAGLVVDTAGTVLHEWPGPFTASLYATGGGHVLATRSPYFVQPLAPESPTAPLVQRLDSAGRPTDGLGQLHVPDSPFLLGPTNAGALAADSSGAFYYAPLARDEISKYDRTGQRLWTARRGLRVHETDPIFLPARGRRLPLALAVTNVALALGPDGRLYALGSEDSAATRLRVDALDAATGTILETRRLEPRQTAVALDARGRMVTFDGDSLLASARPVPREPFTPAFALPDLRGATVALARFAGRVTLVNFWASWCDPCREEFPQMAALYREFSRNDFEIAAISDDVNAAIADVFTSGRFILGELAFWYRPRAIVTLLPERTSGMNQEDFQLPIPLPVHE